MFKRLKLNNEIELSLDGPVIKIGNLKRLELFFTNGYQGSSKNPRRDRDRNPDYYCRKT